MYRPDAQRNALLRIVEPLKERIAVLEDHLQVLERLFLLYVKDDLSP